MYRVIRCNAARKSQIVSVCVCVHANSMRRFVCNEKQKNYYRTNMFRCREKERQHRARVK